MSQDIVERLRTKSVVRWIHNPGATPEMRGHKPDPDCQEAALEIERLRALVEPQPQPEPVAWRYQDARGNFRYRAYKPGFDVEYSILKPILLYAAPQASRTPLTEEQVTELRSRYGWAKETIRAIEAALGVRSAP